VPWVKVWEHARCQGGCYPKEDFHVLCYIPLTLGSCDPRDALSGFCLGAIYPIDNADGITKLVFVAVPSDFINARHLSNSYHMI
jgi:hypothetical protein